MNSSKNKQILARNILRYMDIRDIDRKTLAAKLNVNYNTLCDWLQPGHPSCPKIDIIQKISDLLNVKMHYLLEEHEDPLEDMSFITDKLLESKSIIPVFAKISAGTSYDLIEKGTPITYETVPKNWLVGDRTYFALSLNDDTMEPNYHKNDIAIFLKSSTCNEEDLCCIRIGQEDATFKKVTKLANGILISPLNTNNSLNCEPRFIATNSSEYRSIEILGVLVECRPYQVNR